MLPLADVIWPGVILASRLGSVAPIALGLIVELMCLRLVLKMTWPRAAIADVTMNTVSVIPGCFLVVYGSLAWEASAGRILYHRYGIGTFNPLSWLVSYAIAVAFNTLVEMSVLRAVFRVPMVRKSMLTVGVGNLMSVGIAFVSLWVTPFRS